jgi:hypothetical protein
MKGRIDNDAAFFMSYGEEPLILDPPGCGDGR